MPRAPTLGGELLYLTRDDVLAVGLTDEDVIELVRVALTEHGHGRCEMPAKIGLHPLEDTLMHAMPAYVPAARACGLKWASSFPANAERDSAARNSRETALSCKCQRTRWLVRGSKHKLDAGKTNCQQKSRQAPGCLAGRGRARSTWPSRH